jgi:hypothetical protein
MDIPPRPMWANGELPITLTSPDRSVIQQQKTPVSTFGPTFYRPVLGRFYRQEVPTRPLLSIQFVYSLEFHQTAHCRGIEGG